MSEPIFSRRLLIGWVGAAVATFALSLYFMGRPGEAGGTDAEKLVAAFAGLKVDSPFGPFSFRARLYSRSASRYRSIFW